MDASQKTEWQNGNSHKTDARRVKQAATVMTAVVMIQGGKGITRAAKQGRATALSDAAKPEKMAMRAGMALRSCH